jgi:hypothetical protein
MTEERAKDLRHTSEPFCCAEYQLQLVASEMGAAKTTSQILLNASHVWLSRWEQIKLGLSLIIMSLTR